MGVDPYEFFTTEHENQTNYNYLEFSKRVNNTRFFRRFHNFY